MTPEEFDIDFDFDKEYGYDPVKNNDDSDDFDLDAALARELGEDFDELFEKEFAASQAALNAELEIPYAEHPLEKTRFFGRFQQLADSDDDETEDEIDEEEPAAEEPAEAMPAQEPETADPLDDDRELSALFADMDTLSFEEDEQAQFQEESEETDPVPTPLLDRIDLKAIGEKLNLKGIGEKFAVLGAVIAENGGKFVDALKDCKPGKMDKKQIRRFKNDVLPVLIGGAAFVMCLVFIFGALGRTMNSDERQQAALQESIAQAQAEQEAAAQINKILQTAAVQAAGYDYQGAIDTLDSYKDAETGRELTDEMAAARAEYTAAMTDLVVWDDPAAIPNLSFHVLIEDPDRAYADPVYAGSYRNKFITTEQFSAILEQLYAKGYVLVNLDSCISEATGANGITYTTKPIYLPAGKTPIMITETLVNYFDYMIDGNQDGTPDADGSGFASCLVIDGGKIKAEYIDAAGKTHVGDYDLVPILNTFIDSHPDFSYRGAKAILAVTGDEGVFGWRTNADASLADRAKDIAEVLRAEGYQIASNSFANLDYSGKTTVEQINADLNQWTTNISPILGDVDIMVIAKGSAIKTRGSGFQAMEAAGFHYIIDCTDTPGGELTAEYFHQHRIMVTGEGLTQDLYNTYFSLAQ